MPTYRRPRNFNKILDLPPVKRVKFEEYLGGPSGSIMKAAKFLQTQAVFEGGYSECYHYIQWYQKQFSEKMEAGVEEASALIPPELVEATKKSILEAVSFTERQTSLAAATLHKMKENTKDLSVVREFVALQELQKIAFIQYERTLKFVKSEAKLLEANPDQKAVHGVKENLESTFTMFTKIAQLQMDLGILTKQEKPQNHLHISLQPHQEELLRRFNEQQHVNDLTTEALQIIMGDARGGEEKVLSPSISSG